MSDFNWNDERRLAAQLLADGNLTDSEIAERCGVTRQTIWNWKQTSEFSAVVEEHQEAFRQEVRRRGIASRERRIKALNDRWNRLQRIIERRADDPDMADIPGGDSGLLVKTVRFRSVGEGEPEKTVTAELDAVLLKELREHEKQAAQELGQWNEQAKDEGTSGPTVIVIHAPERSRKSEAE